VLKLTTSTHLQHTYVKFTITYVVYKKTKYDLMFEDYQSVYIYQIVSLFLAGTEEWTGKVSAT